LKRKDGFTLIELIIVLSIILIIAAIVVPSLHITERYALKAAAMELKSDILYTKTKAVKDSKRYWMKIYKDSNLYFITSDAFGPHHKVVYLNEGIEIEEAVFSTDNTIKFTIKGTTGSGGRICLRSKHFRVKITVVPATGRVKIYSIEKIKTNH
jgi:prepilin-type N-terminal cleavage/methylation domain-containing protein